MLPPADTLAGGPRASAKGLMLVALILACAVTSGQELPSAETTSLQISGGTIEVSLPNAPLAVSTDDLLHWVKNAAGAVAVYYGAFPVTHLTLRIRAGRGRGVSHGVTYATNGGLIMITVGQEATVQALADDWVLPHEMTHLAFPDMPDRQHWIEEGLATYVEPVARAQAGQLPVAEVWKQFIRHMPQGEPAAGDEGLDNTPTWGRTYWGGAMFCLIADVKIRERTQNRRGLRDALRAIVRDGGTIVTDWDIEKAFAVGDKATGTSVLVELYRQMRDKPSPVDLDQLWNQLGVALKDGDVTFNDKAPKAAIRQAITSPSQKEAPR
jgi:hypothetical protein